MPPKYVRVEGGSDGSARVYFRLKGVVNDMWESGAPPGDSFDRWVKKFPFAIGRVQSADEDIGLGGDNDCWFVCDSQKVSRKHAVISYDERSQQFKLKCYSNNGVDVNQRHILKDEEAPLPSRSTVRIGPAYFFFLLPKDRGPGGVGEGAGSGAAAAAAAAAAGGGGGAAAAAAAAPKKSNKITVPGGYSSVVDAVYKKNFAAWGYFTLQDLMHLAMADFPAHGLQEDLDKLKTTLTRAITNHADFDFHAGQPPKDVMASFESVHAGSAAQKSTKWIRHLDAAAAAAKKTRLAAAAAQKAEAKGAAAQQVEE